MGETGGELEGHCGSKSLGGEHCGKGMFTKSLTVTVIKCNTSIKNNNIIRVP